MNIITNAVDINLQTTHNATSNIISEIMSKIEELEERDNQVAESKMTKSKMVSDGLGLLVVERYMDGKKIGSYNIMPDIMNVREYNDDNGNPCAIYLDFADGTSTCAARRDTDVFSFEHGVTICIAKKLLDKLTGDLGNQTYNKIVRRVCKLHDQIIKDEEEALKEQQAYEYKLNKLAEKKRKRIAKREAEMLEEENQLREHFIEIQKEAFVRALKECGLNGDDLK